jgi:hypothetical protein
MNTPTQTPPMPPAPKLGQEEVKEECKNKCEAHSYPTLHQVRH